MLVMEKVPKDEAKKKLIVEEAPENKPTNYGEEQAKCSMYFMDQVEVQVQEDEHWAKWRSPRGTTWRSQEGGNLRENQAPKRLQSMIIMVG